MINIFQAPLLGQLRRGLLLYWLLIRKQAIRKQQAEDIRRKMLVEIQALLPLWFLPGYCLGHHHLFSSFWFSSPSFLYVSFSSSSPQTHSRSQYCPSFRHNPVPCPSLCLHRCPEEETTTGGWWCRCSWFKITPTHKDLRNLLSSCASWLWLVSLLCLSSLHLFSFWADLSSCTGPLGHIPLAVRLPVVAKGES